MILGITRVSVRQRISGVFNLFIIYFQRIHSISSGVCTNREYNSGLWSNFTEYGVGPIQPIPPPHSSPHPNEKKG